jgi:hypothetical protein
MEDDDEFGDLYTDIVLPTPEPSKPPPAQILPRAAPAPAPNPNSAPAPASTAPAAAAADEDDDDDDWLLGGSDPLAGVDPTADWVGDDDDGAAAPSAKREVDAKPRPAAEDPDPLMGLGEDDDDPGAAIPGLSSSAAAAATGAAAGSEYSDSDSEDDLRIVLNETDGRRRLGDDEGDDEDGLDLIIADGPHITGMEEQEWAEDGAAAGPDGERKEGGEPGKTMAMPGVRIGYSGGGQGFHPQHHSMYKVSYSGQEAVRCARPAPAEGDRVNPVATRYALCCTL